jgi:hypothetical protein
MSHVTSHTYRGFSIRFDELEPQNSITMSKATWNALLQLETGSEEVAAQRYQVKSKPKFADGEHTVESHHATKAEAEDRARTLKAAGYDTQIVEPTEALEPPKSYGRYRVHSQVTPLHPFAQVADFNEEGDAQAHARELEDKGFGTQIVDSNSGAVVQNVYPDGTAVAPELIAMETQTGEITADDRAVPAPIENEPPAA